VSDAGRATARSVALKVVMRVTGSDAYSNLAIAGELDRAELSVRDAAFATELAYGTIRRLLRLDHALDPLVDRPLDRTPASALAALRLGAYQLLFTRVPAHAAVAETVNLVPRRQRGFVNAVLRRLAAEGARWPEGGEDLAVALRTGLAEWAVAELRRLVSDDVEAAALALAEPAPITLRTNTCETTVEELEGRLADARLVSRRGSLHAGSLTVDGGRPSELPGFGEGWFAVQDQASSFVVDALEPDPTDRVLDVCAGPGGKTGHLGCLVGERGLLVASDISTGRARLVRSAVERLGGRALVLVQDGRRPAIAGSFERVLVDAPCSGLGSARRRPELLWRARKADLSGLARLQVGITTAVADLLPVGGRLVYSVCTFPRAETDAVCDALLRRRPDLAPAPIRGPDGVAERIRLWPHRHGCDAMFVAAFRRLASSRR